MTNAKTIVVSNAAELKAALSARAADTTIVLKQGNYGDFALNAKGSDLGIKLVAADASKPPIFSTLSISNANGVSIEGAQFTPNPALKFAAGLTLRGCDDVMVTKSTFAGAPGAFESQQRGIYVDKSTSVSILDNDFTALMRGVVMTSTDGAKLIGNDVHGMRSEGFNFAGVSHVEIADNKMGDFKPFAGDHPDFIQFWTRGMTRASEDIHIHDNTLVQKALGLSAQGIFMDNDDHIRYKNVVIENNVIQTGMPRGITVQEADGVKVLNNTVLGVDGSTTKVSIHVVDSTAAKVVGNVSNALSLAGSKILEDLDNIVTQTKIAEPAKMAAVQLKAVVEAPNPINGTDGNDKLTGTARDDILTGGKGDDVLNGGAGNDIVIGGAGSDMMTGGAGADRFVFQASTMKGVEIDKILDFSFKEGDTLKFEGFDKLFGAQGPTEIASLQDLAKFAHLDDVVVSRKGTTDLLIVTVNDDHGGSLQIHMSNMYAAYTGAGGELI